MPVKCPKCGFENSDGSNYCRSCSNPLNQFSQQQAPRPRQPRPQQNARPHSNVQPQKPPKPEKPERLEFKGPSKLYYLLPIFLNIPGGIVAFIMTYKRDMKMARKMLIIGIAIGVALVMIPVMYPLLNMVMYMAMPGLSGNTSTGGAQGNIPTPGQPSCSPCFNSFSYVNYTNGTLTVKNGPGEVTINSINLGITDPSSPCTVGGLCEPGSDMVIFGMPTTGTHQIIINYTITATGIQKIDGAFIHN